MSIQALFVSKDMLSLKQLVNSTVSQCNEIYVKYIANTKSEMLEILSRHYVDLLILDIRDFDFTLNELIKKINFLIICQTELLIKLVNESYQKVQIEENKIESVCNLLKEIIKNNRIANCNIKNNILLELSNMGYNLKHIGTYYVLEAIMLIYEANSWDKLDNLQKNIYTVIAKNHNKSLNNIKTNIIKATNLKSRKSGMALEYTPKEVITHILTKFL
ncbi:MAG: hypothetical protein HFJ23_06715 [Clostridia bacterium]|nr:hypothetical protein [Clostridia bacterium]